MSGNEIFIKQMQMLIVTGIGAIICLLGIWLLYRQIMSPKPVRAGDIELQAPGFKVKMVRSLPGAMITIIGGLLIYWSLNSGAERKVRVVTEEETTDNNTKADILPVWLRNAANLNGREDYIPTIKAITGDANFRVENIVLPKAKTLEALAIDKYSDKRYWLLISKINASREYYKADSVKATTLIPAGSVIEFWFPAKNKRVKTYEEFVKVRGTDLRDAYEQLLTMIEKGLVASEQEDRKLTEQFRPQELSYSVAYEEVDGETTINELALKYYRNKKYAPLIRWRNSELLKASIKNTDSIPKGTTIAVPNFVP